jgi:hypothetical protein
MPVCLYVYLPIARQRIGCAVHVISEESR